MYDFWRLGKNFRSKIIAPVAVLLILLSATQIIYLSTKFSSYSNYLKRQKIESHASHLNSFLEKSRKQSRVAAISMAQNALVISAIKERNREKLIQIISAIQEFYDMNFCTITDHTGKVIARTHDPDNFGDSVLGQQNIQDALNGKISTFFEEGTVVKVSARTGAPVYDENRKLVGAVSFGVRFDTPGAVQRLKALSNSEVSVFWRENLVASTVVKDDQMVDGSRLDPDIVQTVLHNRQEFFGDTNLFGDKYKTFYKPLINSRDEVFAVFFVGIPLKEFNAAAAAFIRDGIIISMIGLLISIALLYFIISTISRPITRLSTLMQNVADGDLNISINPRGDDEVGHLSASLLKVVNIMHKLLADINHMIDEQKKGATQYQFDSSEFRGDFKVLADNILELAIVGMKDQLTEIPNRRSFDSRLELEWHRAMREIAPLSLLMIDVDRFKDYNDNYGHPQGDQALRTIAGLFALCAARPADIAARWGGEEFVVLLPQTDAEGALQVAERIRSSVENAEIPYLANPAAKSVTVSIGVTTHIPSPVDSIEDFVFKADTALYEAKNMGRNRTVYGD